MVAYFRKQTWICLFAGLLVGLLAAYLSYRSFLYAESTIVQVSFLAMLALLGVVFGRIVAFRLASKRLAALTALLYDQCNPKAFIEAFEPILKKTPKDNIAYFDGVVKLSYAYEALGEFDKAAEILFSADPATLKMHSLHARAMLGNQKLKVYLLKGDIENSSDQLEVLLEVESAAETRAKLLASQIHACTELGKHWLAFLKGEEFDADYVKDEAELAKNNIYRAEMEILYANMLIKLGKAEEAREYYEKAQSLVPNLWAGQEAAKFLK